MNDEERVGKVQLCLSHRLGNLGFTYYSMKILCYLDHCRALQSALGVIILNYQIKGFHIKETGYHIYFLGNKWINTLVDNEEITIS